MRESMIYSKSVIKRGAYAIGLAAMAFFLTSCGRTEYKPVASVQQQKSPGTYTIPPKVDILMVVDDTGSIYQAYNQIVNQVPYFLQGLEKQKWDYHFATIPLTTYRSIRQVIGSKFDPNWADLWQAPYPGAIAGEISSINPSVFTQTKNYTDFISLSDVNSSLNGMEPGFQTIRDVLKNGTANTGFLRDDALFVMLMVGNGDDTSGVNYCTRAADGKTVPCEQESQPTCVPTAQDPIRGGSTTCKSANTSFDYYKSEFQKINPHLRFYAAVAFSSSSNCLGGYSDNGARYQKMATALNGKSYNVCSQPITTVLKDLTADLQAQRYSYHTQYLTVDREPVETSIKVTRFVNGDGAQAVELVKSDTNGWTYEKYRNDVFAIYAVSPGGRKIEMNRIEGYVIHLHGTGELIGMDTASVEFTPADAKSSAPAAGGQ